MEEQKTTIEAKELSIGYKNTVVSENIGFKLRSNELCAIIGINGIGKSTLLRTLGKLQPKLSGEILIESQPLENCSPLDFARQTSVVLTEPIASKNLTVQELITLGRQPYTNWLGSLTTYDEKHIKESIQNFELEQFKEKKCHELSDGQLQRVLIARAMAQDTPLILLDEPTTHLDLYHKVQILKLLQELAHEHDKTIVFTTHEIDLAIQLCDKILILDGRENPFASPCELVEKGCFNTLFPSEMVKFDTKTGSFKVNK
ncbi:ABC transporter ATP-binding protein [Croceitalea sp. MTPC9]|uniref:ABC transporter ATP-binding protein n=1 Tax=unclassified Croceitalea TaxID=2632280 RepID=UPI002B3F1620|nr:ABC transporter ATP-binding protein [Croceitalea sp. MTPC6]GMN15414.1 ABC transporter ATP-binding protein [Croceitalea sp. MTPC9]